jgi:hypothetical protein
MRERTAWIMGGIAAALPVVGLLIWLNLDGGGSAIEIPLLPASPSEPSHPRLKVLEEPGKWELVSTAKSVTSTNTNTGTLHAYWGLNGHCLILEAEMTNPAGEITYDLSVKHFNDQIDHYHYTLIQDDGYVRGLIGKWKTQSTRMDWWSVYLPGAPSGVSQRIVEQQLAPSERKTNIDIVNNNQVELAGSVESKRVGEREAAPATQPATPELARLGTAGVWQEVESVMEEGKLITNRINGRSRWTRGGRALIYEGVIDNNGEGVYFMWVKTYDRMDGIYRFVYFFKDGPVDHFVGKWDEATKTIVWRSIQPPGNRVIHETFTSPTHRTWRVEFFDNERKLVSSSDGESRLKE